MFSVIENTYDADARLEIRRDAEAIEEPLVGRVSELHLIQLQDRRRQLLKVIRETVGDQNQTHVHFRQSATHTHTHTQDDGAKLTVRWLQTP